MPTREIDEMPNSQAIGWADMLFVRSAANRVVIGSGGPVIGTGGLTLQNADTFGWADAIVSLLGNNSIGLPSITVSATAAIKIPLIIKAYASQEGNLQEWQNSSATVLSSIGPSGKLALSQSSDPTAYLHLGAGTATANTAPLKFTSGTNLTTPEDGAIEFNGKSLYFTAVDVRRSIVVGNDIRVADATVTNTTTETTIHTSAIAANALAAGTMYKITLLGKTTTANASQFYTLRFKMGGTTLLTFAMAAADVTDAHFRSESYITIRTIGASGTYAAHIEGTLGSEEVTTTPVTGSVDTTTTADMTVTLQWDAANAGNIFTIMQAVLEVVG